MLLEELEAAVRASCDDGQRPRAILLHPQTPVHAVDPCLGLPALTAMEIDAVDGLPVIADETVPFESIRLRLP